MSCRHHRHHRRHQCPERGDLFGDLCRSIGERVVVVIRGDGPNGTFKGTLCEVKDCAVHVVLTHETDHIKAGDMVTIPLCEISAFARLR